MAMTSPLLRVLIIEDSPDDLELLLRALDRYGYDVTYECVETAAEMTAALKRGPWDVVLSDYVLPTFSAPAALELVKQAGQDVPFVIVSGTIGEEAAVSALKAGAHDFLVKGRLAGLGRAIERELRDVVQRRERLELEDQFRQAQKMEAIGLLAGGVAHDFNNLLTAILGYSELLLDRVRNQEDLAADVEEIRKAGERAGSLTRQLLAFSRRQVLQPRILDLNEVVADLEKMLRRVIGEDVRLEVILAPSLNHIKADLGQIEQVLMNFAVNARDAMPRGGVLTIQTADAALPPEFARSQSECPPHGYVALIVRDTGCGMSADVRARIFEPFFTTKGPDKGTGLGLSTVYGIVTQSGGHIKVESERSEGSAFTVYLPAAADAGDRLEPTPVAPTGFAGTETILLVDDEAGIRELVWKALQRYGYTVLKAAEARTALTIVQHHPGTIDLLITDIVMPEMSGPDLAQRIVSHQRGIRVLYISGYAHGGLGFGLMSPRTAFLQKPFTPEALARKVRECLRDRPVPSHGPS